MSLGIVNNNNHDRLCSSTYKYEITFNFIPKSYYTYRSLKVKFFIQIHVRCKTYGEKRVIYFNKLSRRCYLKFYTL